LSSQKINSSDPPKTENSSSPVPKKAKASAPASVPQSSVNQINSSSKGGATGSASSSKQSAPKKVAEPLIKNKSADDNKDGWKQLEQAMNM
jgi:hypothetical protein